MVLAPRHRPPELDVAVGELTHGIVWRKLDGAANIHAHAVSQMSDEATRNAERSFDASSPSRTSAVKRAGQDRQRRRGSLLQFRCARPDVKQSHAVCVEVTLPGPGPN